ncbi:MAG: HAD-IA family hydrolase [Acidobacteriota bacterium]
MLKALIFDCDGVLVDTERDGHRVAFNRAFAAKGLDAEWSVDKYHELLQVAGGKERFRHYFNSVGWPEDAQDQEAYVKELHKLKTDLFMGIIESGELNLRPGVARLIDEAITAGITLAVCSTSNERAVTQIVDKLLGPVRKRHFSAILAGDVVRRKKPDPEIYLKALQVLGITSAEAVVVEDSRVGLMASAAAGISCLVTVNGYTALEDTSGADLVVSELGDPPDVQVTLDTVRELARISRRLT